MSTTTLGFVLFGLSLAMFTAGYGFGSASGRERTDRAINAGQEALASLTRVTTSLEDCNDVLLKYAREAP